MSPYAALVRRARDRFRSAPAHSARATLRLVREDLWAHNGEWARPGFHAMATHRLGAYLLHAPRLTRTVLWPFYQAMYVWVRNLYGIELPATTVVGRRLRFSHQSGIVIHPGARIGDDCVIRQNVTIGAPNMERSGLAPVLGNNVELGAGAAIIGRVTVGDGARIGPNAVVMTNVPAGSTVVAPRPRTVQLVHRPAPPAGDRVSRPERPLTIAPPSQGPAGDGAPSVRDAG